MLEPDLIVSSDTDQRLANGIRRCIAQITPQHSVTSRRHAISTLIKAELDAEIDRVIGGYRRSWSWPLLDGFCLSRAWLCHPNGSPEPAPDMTSLARANHCAAQWRARLRRAIHSAYAREPDHTRKDLTKFCGTLDSVMALIDAFSALHPAVTHGPMGRVSLQAMGHGVEYCELCWRKTEWFTHGHQRDASDRSLGWSRRFCSEHNPKTSASNYRRDLQYKQRYLDEQVFIRRHKLTMSNVAFVFLPDAHAPSGLELHFTPASAHPEDVRRAAYAMVRSGLQGTASQCLAFASQGVTVAQIAERLGITARAVRLAIARAQPKLKQALTLRKGGMPDAPDTLRAQQSDVGFDRLHSKLS